MSNAQFTDCPGMLHELQRSLLDLESSSVRLNGFVVENELGGDKSDNENILVSACKSGSVMSKRFHDQTERWASAAALI